MVDDSRLQHPFLCPAALSHPHPVQVALGLGGRARRQWDAATLERRDEKNQSLSTAEPGEMEQRGQVAFQNPPGMSRLVWFFSLHASFDLAGWTNTLRADGTTEVTPRGPAPRNSRRSAAHGGPARGGSRRKRRRKPSARRRPKNVNTARRSAPRPKRKAITGRRGNGRCLQRGSPGDPVLHPVAPQIGISHQAGGGAAPLCLSGAPGPTPDRTRPVIPDPEGGQGHTRDPGADPGLRVSLCPGPNLSLTLGRGPDPGQDPGTDPGHHLEGGVCPGPRERGSRAKLHLITQSLGPTKL